MEVRMNKIIGGIVVAVLLVSALPVWGEEGHEHEGGDQAPRAGSKGEQTLTGEVTDVFCYLSHPAEGIGPKHAGCAKKCIKSGLPVAIRVGNQLYLATMADHNPANSQLVEFAGQTVSVRGKVMELEGQRLIAVSSVQKAE
jgi:hypothetical protein